MNYDKKDIATSLRALRARKQVSRAKVAQSLGICSDSLFKYEHGQGGMSLSTAVALANYYGVTVEELIEG